MGVYIIVGAGITGAVIARYLAEQNHEVVVVDKRNHIAGNVFDEKDGNGILVQKYGPHIFHTNNKQVFDYINKYGQWNPFKLECMVFMNGKFTPSPFNFTTIDDFFSREKANQIKKHIQTVYGKAEKATIVDMLNSADDLIREYADFLFKNDYSLYTAKQWGISPSEIDVSVLKRVPVLFTDKTSYFDDAYQCMPVCGYTAFVSRILDHRNITVKLNTDALSFLSVQNGLLLIDGNITDKTVIYTGAIDEFFGCKYGRLPYRSLRFEYRTENTDSYQDAPVVAYPQADGFTRITEYTKLPVQKTNGKTKIAVEYPMQYAPDDGNDPYYPVLTEESQKQYAKYKALADSIPNLICCGRLGDFKYYNMDQALERALRLCEQIP